MVMDEVKNKLKELQDILSQKIELEKEIHEIPKMLTTQEELLSRLKKSFIEKNQEYEKVRAAVSEFKKLLFEAETNREKAEKNMDVISTQREYEALDKEIRDASEKEQQYRKDLQREERNYTELKEELERDTALIEQQETELQERSAGVEAEVSEKKKELAALEESQKKLEPGLDPEILFKFERIIRNKMGRGIVAIKGGVCTGCHMILPAQFANEVRNGEDIIFCPYCSRILFFEDTDQSEQDFFNDDDAGSLADLDDFDGDDEDFEDDDDSGKSDNNFD